MNVVDYLRFIGASDQTAKEVKIFNLSDFLADRFKTLSDKYYYANRNLAIKRAAWGSFLYMIISIIIGTVYFTWAVYGISLSLIFALFIFGLPFSVLFILSTQGFAWLEGRIVEGMLGVRMPRRPIFFPKEGKWIDRLKMYLRDKRTWFTLLYMILLMPISVVYITIWTVSFGVSILLIGSPVIQEIFHLPMVTLGSKMVFMPIWSLPLLTLLGFIFLTAFLHLAKKIGQFHGRFAKRMLVIE